MSNMNFNDTISINDDVKIMKTRVRLMIKKADGTELFRDLGENASLIGGVQDYVHNMWNIQSSDRVRIHTLDDAFTSGLPIVNSYTSDKRQVFGIGIGIDGAVGDNIVAVNRHSKGFELDKLVAFHTVNPALEDVAAATDKYAFRVEDSGDILYYIKKIVPEYKIISARTKNVVQDYPDTTYTRSEDVRCHVRIKSKIEKDEVTRWFGKKQGSIDNPRFNSIIVFAGRPCTLTIGTRNVNTWRDVIATNKINFKNINLINVEVSIIYDIYFV